MDKIQHVQFLLSNNGGVQQAPDFKNVYKPQWMIFI